MVEMSPLGYLGWTIGITISAHLMSLLLLLSLRAYDFSDRLKDDAPRRKWVTLGPRYVFSTTAWDEVLKMLPKYSATLFIISASLVLMGLGATVVFL